MNTVCKINQCNGCFACVDKCPKKCISIVDNIYSMNAVKNMNECINCGICESICPNLNKVAKLPSMEWYQGWAEAEIRCNSSSGGVASALIINFIKMGGYVASCIFEDGEFVFKLTNDLKIAKKFAGSKYVKSSPLGIYKKIDDRLKTDKVLFIGLPCQVAALKNYVRNNDNLFTVDLICHGTPSLRILKRYISETGFDIKKLSNVTFRTKNFFRIGDNHVRLLEKGTDKYSIAFLNGVDYTENCYSCQYASRERVSDITLGDSWGSKLKEEICKGISLILVQTDKGKEIIERANLVLKNVDYELAVNSNHQLIHPVLLKPEREEFFKLIEKGLTVKQAVRKVMPVKVFKQKIKYVLIRLHLLNVGGGTK